MTAPRYDRSPPVMAVIVVSMTPVVVNSRLEGRVLVERLIERDGSGIGAGNGQGATARSRDHEKKQKQDPRTLEHAVSLPGPEAHVVDASPAPAVPRAGAPFPARRVSPRCDSLSDT